MEIRVLRYFLTVAREENISRAAEQLHITQPTLSRQLMDLERELQTKLFHRSRSRHSITLTRDGYRFRQRAEEIVALADKTTAEFTVSDAEAITGDIYIGCTEIISMNFIIRAIRQLQIKHPLIRYHIFDGNERDLTEHVQSGYFDFGIVVGDADVTQYESLQFSIMERRGLVMRNDHPLAKKDSITPQDFRHLSLIMPQQELQHDSFTSWLGFDPQQLSIPVTFNLAYNAFLMAEEGIGCVLCLEPLDRIRDPLCFRPLSPELDAQSLYLVWKKNRPLSKPAKLLLDEIRKQNT